MTFTPRGQAWVDGLISPGNLIDAEDLNRIEANGVDADTRLDTLEAASRYTTVQDEGTVRTQRATINFVGAGVSATDDAGGVRTTVTIPGGGSTPGVGAFVYQSGGNTVAVNRAGAVITSLATSAANNVTVIQAAIDAMAGANSAGLHGGGGSVQLSDEQYQINAQINIKYGVSLRGTSRNFDRGGATYNEFQASTNGTTLRPTVNNIRAISMGVATTVGVHLATNPHGVEISNLQIDGHGVTGVTGIYIIDLTDPHIVNVLISDCATGIDVDSTQPPNDGGTVACKIIGCDILGCDIGIDISATSGATDGEITSCRILASTSFAVNLTRGGWQISQCHMTTSNAAPHINMSGSPCMATNNYFDTAGSASQITLSTGNCNITGNYFTSSSGQTANITVSGNGTRSSIMGNTVDLGADNLGFVKLPAGTISTMPIVVSGNIIDKATAAGFVDVVISSTNAVVADQDTANGPYIKGNRTF